MSTLTETWNDFVAPIVGVWDEFVEFVMWLCCSVLGFANVGLCWILNKGVDSD